MKQFLLMVVAAMMATMGAKADPTFNTKDVPVNRGGQDGGTISLLFYEDLPSVPYVSVADFQQLMLPGTTIEVAKTADGEYTLTGPFAKATVNTTTEQFASDDYMAFTNLMGTIQKGMDNAYLDGAPFVRYSRQELTPAQVTTTFDFKKYGIDLRGDDQAVYFPLATLSDIYSDLYYHVAGYNGEKVLMVTDNNNATIATFEPERTRTILQAESRSEDMAAFSYGELCFNVDHFYGMPGRSPLEEAIQKDGLDKALDTAENGPTIKKLLKSTKMMEYFLGMECLQILLQDGGHTDTKIDFLAYNALSEDTGYNDWQEAFATLSSSYPELVEAVNQQIAISYGALTSLIEDIEMVRPTKDTYYKEGDTAYLLFPTFGPTNFAAWKAYYEGGAKGDTPAIDPKFLGDMSVVLDALKKADDDPEVKNLVVDLSTNTGGSLDVVMAMTALMGQQSHMYCENILTGQRQTVYYDVDCNFDGQFDEQDKAVKYDLNFAVLTSRVAFSCANLFPSLMKDMGFPIIGERSGGGACAIQNFISPEGLQYQLSSCRARLTDDKWQVIDAGVEPTDAIDVASGDYSPFYDVAAISEIIKNSQATAIDTPAVVVKADDGIWYTLDGRRINGQPTRKGVYISSGKKLFVK